MQVGTHTRSIRVNCSAKCFSAMLGKLYGHWGELEIKA